MLKKFLKELGVFLGKKNDQGFPVRYDEWGKEVNLPAFTNYDWSEVYEPITRKQAKAWVKELRSGAYEQTGGVLKDFVTRDNNEVVQCGYCCLGVFAEANGMLKTEGDPDPNDEDKYWDVRFTSKVFDDGESGAHSFLRTSVGARYQHYVLPHPLQIQLAEMNDEKDYTFNQIADTIEELFGL